MSNEVYCISVSRLAKVYTQAYQIANIVCYFELSISTRALCMNDTLWYTFAIEVCQQIDQMEILQQQRAILPYSLRAFGIWVDLGFSTRFSRAEIEH